MRLQVVSFSTGLSSAITVERVLSQFHPSQVTIVFMDTLAEHPDNYRFMFDCHQRWREVYGSQWQFIRLCEGKTPREVWEHHSIIPNQKIAPCTFDLKIQPFTQLMLDLACGLPIGFSRNVFGSIKNIPFKVAAQDLLRIHEVIVHIGFDLIADAHRIDPCKKAYKSYGFDADFPLTWKPYEYRPYTEVSREDWGVEPPTMYRLNYSHANCGGYCCRQGIGDWLKTEEHDPAGYYDMADWELWQQKQIGSDYTFCRDQRGNTLKRITLHEVAERKKDFEQRQPSIFNCINCGVGDLLDS